LQLDICAIHFSGTKTTSVKLQRIQHNANRISYSVSHFLFPWAYLEGAAAPNQNFFCSV